VTERIVLAYSGGLDTSVAIGWIGERTGAEVVAVAVDVGQGGEDLETIRKRALACGAVEAYVADARAEFAEQHCLPALQANALYMERYPLVSALSRPLIVKHLVAAADQHGATAVAHGCTGKGNDQVRFEAGIAALHPDLLQLHGKETPKRVLAVKARFRLPVMKAIAVESRDDLACVPDYAEVADRLIFDAHAPRDATRPGGLGRPFDWRILKNLDPRVPFMLSGGLRPDNVAEALAITRARGVDVSSGVERAPGAKDADRIRAFIRAVRGAAEGQRAATHH